MSRLERCKHQSRDGTSIWSYQQELLLDIQPLVVNICSFHETFLYLVISVVDYILIQSSYDISCHTHKTDKEIKRFKWSIKEALVDERFRQSFTSIESNVENASRRRRCCLFSVSVVVLNRIVLRSWQFDENRLVRRLWKCFDRSLVRLESRQSQLASGAIRRPIRIELFRSPIQRRQLLPESCAQRESPVGSGDLDESRIHRPAGRCRYFLLLDQIASRPRQHLRGFLFNIWVLQLWNYWPNLLLYR